MNILIAISIAILTMIGNEATTPKPIVVATTLSVDPIPQVSITIDNTVYKHSDLSYTNTMRIGNISDSRSFAIDWTLQDGSSHSATLTVPDIIRDAGLYELRISEDGHTIDGNYQIWPENVGTSGIIGQGMFDSSDPVNKQMHCDYPSEPEEWVEYPQQIIDGPSSNQILKTWHPNGQLRSNLESSNNRMYGISQRWDEEGNVIEDGIYKNGEPWSGKLIIYQKVNELPMVGTYSNGILLKEAFWEQP